MLKIEENNIIIQNKIFNIKDISQLVISKTDLTNYVNGIFLEIEIIFEIFFLFRNKREYFKIKVLDKNYKLKENLIKEILNLERIYSKFIKEKIKLNEELNIKLGKFNLSLNKDELKLIYERGNFFKVNKIIKEKDFLILKNDDYQEKFSVKYMPLDFFIFLEEKNIKMELIENNEKEYKKNNYLSLKILLSLFFIFNLLMLFYPSLDFLILFNIYFSIIILKTVLSYLMILRVKNKICYNEKNKIDKNE